MGTLIAVLVIAALVVVLASTGLLIVQQGQTIVVDGGLALE